MCFFPFSFQKETSLPVSKFDLIYKISVQLGSASFCPVQ